MTNREFRLLVEAVIWRKRFEDSNPSIGIGPFFKTLIKEVAENADIEIDNSDIKLIELKMKDRMGDLYHW